MKKILLLLVAFIALRSNAQIANGSFENWALDTASFAGFTGFVAADVFPYHDPVGWTSTNGVTGASGLGGHFLVSQSGTAQDGSSSIQLVTDTLKTITGTPLGDIRLVVPGIILNGIFPVNSIISQTTLIAGGTISPAAVPNAGQPCAQRLASFNGYYQYAPVVDTFTHSNDTCVIWATLRKGSTIVANAEFKSAVSTNGTFAPFTVPFVYSSCEIPDTLVVLLASSLPKFAGILSGNTGLVPGSVLLVDNLSYDTLLASNTIVIAANDIDTAHRNAADTIDVLNNDASCSSLNLTVSITTGPVNGTATVWNNKIIYTPNGTMGNDSIYYTDTDPNNYTSSAWVKIYTTFGVGISEATEIAVNMFPVPVSNELHVQFENKGRTTAHIYDVVGNLVNTVTLTSNNNNINIANLTNGIYGIQLVDETNAIIARGKFAVSK